MKKNPTPAPVSSPPPSVEGDLRWTPLGEFRIESRTLVPLNVAGLQNRQPRIYRLLFLDQARMDEAWLGKSRSLGSDLRAFARGGGPMPGSLRKHVLGAIRMGRRVWIEVVEPSRLKFDGGKVNLKNDLARAMVLQLAILQTSATVKKILEFGLRPRRGRKGR